MNEFLALIPFAVPLLTLVRPVWRALGLAGTRLNGALGCLERYLSRWREAAAAGWAVWLLASGASPESVMALVIVMALARWQRGRSELASADIMFHGPGLEADTFFRVGNQAYGPAGGPSEPPPQPGRPAAGYDLRSNASGKLRWAFLKVFFDSTWMTRIAMRSARRHGASHLKNHIELGMRLWGLRVLQHAGGYLVTEGMEQLKGLTGKRLFLFNHVSQTDFALGFPALDHFIRTDEEIRLRFIVAKDYFVDNPVIHSWSGIGRLIMAIGMVPIDRKRTRNAIGSLEAASRLIAEERIDLAMYPQGTRGRAHLDEAGEGIDVGFYSSGRRPRDPLGHIKSGSAFLALDVAMELRKRNQPLHLVIVGVEGAGRLLPKGRLSMTAGVTLTYRVSEVITLDPADVAGLQKRGADGSMASEIKQRATELTRRIERALAKASRIDARLADLWQELLGRPMPDSASLRRLFDHALAMEPARREPLFDKLRQLPEKVTDEEVSPLFDMLPPT